MAVQKCCLYTTWTWVHGCPKVLSSIPPEYECMAVQMRCPLHYLNRDVNGRAKEGSPWQISLWNVTRQTAATNQMGAGTGSSERPNWVHLNVHLLMWWDVHIGRQEGAKSKQDKWSLRKIKGGTSKGFQLTLIKALKELREPGSKELNKKMFHQVENIISKL